MIVIKNISEERLVLIQHVDTSVPGCRVVPPAVSPMRIKPGEEITFMAYEPGISYTIQPVRSPQYPRVPAEPESGCMLKFRAIAPKGVVP